MLNRTGRWSDTVCLRLLVPGKDPVADFKGVRTIDYTKSWVRAIPRMAMGLPVVLFAAGFFFVFMLAALSAYVSFFLIGVITVAGAAAYYYSAFVRPTINRKAKVALRTVLRAAEAPAPQGIGGWLILPIIQLILTPIAFTYRLLTYLLWRPLAFEITGGLVIIVLAIDTLVLLLLKSKKTANFAIAWWSVSVVYAVLDYYLADLIPAVAEQSSPDDAIRPIWAIASAAIWIPYFIFSRRVKATFVR
jgi:hypothetical protein